MRKHECPFFIAKIPHIEVIFMQTQVNFSYFYGEESEQFSYFRIPRLLVRSKKFKTLSTDAKLLYGLMLDRMGLSAKHGWYDELGRVYIYYTLDEIQTDLMCGHNKAVRLLAELDTGKNGFGLIERVKQGQGRPAKIYVKKFTTTEVPEVPPSASISDFPDSEMQTSQKQTSRLPFLGSQDFPKEEPSYLDNNYPEFSYPDPSISPAKPPGNGWIERWSLKESVKNQIEYDALCTQYASEDVDAMVELIAEKNLALVEKLEVVSRSTIREKLLTYLSRQAEAAGSRTFTIPMGRVALAEYLCADRSAMTRELAHMKAEGLIDYDKRSFTLLYKSAGWC